MNYIHELVEASNFGFCTENTTFKTEKIRIFLTYLFFKPISLLLLTINGIYFLMERFPR